MPDDPAWLYQLVRSDAERRSATGDPDEIQAYINEAMNYLHAMYRGGQRAQNQVYDIGGPAGSQPATASPYTGPSYSDAQDQYMQPQPERQYASPDVQARPPAAAMRQRAYSEMLGRGQGVSMGMAVPNSGGVVLRGSVMPGALTGEGFKVAPRYNDPRPPAPNPYAVRQGALDYGQRPSGPVRSPRQEPTPPMPHRNMAVPNSGGVVLTGSLRPGALRRR